MFRHGEHPVSIRLVARLVYDELVVCVARVRHFVLSGHISQTEDIQYDLDSTIIVIKGIGTSNGEIVHDARAIISPADSKNSFDFYSFLSDGRKGKFLMEKEGDIIKWYIDTEGGEIRYTITLKGDTYHEIGEFGMGGQWYPFFEMNLIRKDS